MTSQALITQDTSPLLPSQSTWATMYAMAEQFYASNLLPAHIKSPAAALLIMQKGIELRLPPVQALSTIGVIGGKPVVAAETMLAIIYRDLGDHVLRIVETDNDHCRIWFKRDGWDAGQEYSFTAEDAKKAGLFTNPIWTKYTAAMLRARCISAAAKMGFPDIISGMHTPEEMGASMRVVNGELVADLTISAVEEAPPPPAKPNPHNANLSTGEIPARQLAAGMPAPQPQAPQVEQPRLCSPQQIEQYNALRASWLAMDPQHSAKPANPQATAEQMAAGIAVLQTRIDRYEQPRMPTINLSEVEPDLPTPQLVAVGAPDEADESPF